MANTGYSVAGSQCVADAAQALVPICNALLSNWASTGGGCQIYTGYGHSDVQVFVDRGGQPYTYAEVPLSSYRNCDPTGGVLTVQDGVSLGWMVGGTILMVGAVMFLAKVVRI